MLPPINVTDVDAYATNEVQPVKGVYRSQIVCLRCAQPVESVRSALFSTKNAMIGIGPCRGRIRLRINGNAVVFRLLTFRTGTILGPIFEGRLIPLSSSSCLLCGTFRHVNEEIVAYGLAGIGIFRFGTEQIEKSITPGALSSFTTLAVAIVIVVVFRAILAYLWIPRQFKTDLMLSHFESLGFVREEVWVNHSP